MIWVAAGIVALGVLAAAAFAGMGRLGEMPQDPVTDHFRGQVPDGPVTEQFLEEAVLPTALNGYSRPQVDQYLHEIAAGTASPEDEVRFKVVSNGYAMSVIDELLARERYERPTPADSVELDDEAPVVADEAEAERGIVEEHPDDATSEDVGDSAPGISEDVPERGMIEDRTEADVADHEADDAAVDREPTDEDDEPGRRALVD